MDDSEVYQAYLTERKQLLEGRLHDARSYDKWLLTLAAGSLGLSLTFLESIAGANPTGSWLLVVGWSSLVLAMLLLMLAMRESVKAHDASIAIMDSEWPDGQNGFWERVRKRQRVEPHARWVVWIDGLGLLFFVFGIAGILVFALANLKE